MLIVGAGIGIALMLPIAPISSPLWDLTSQVHDNFIDQLGWEELVEETAPIYQREKANVDSLAILTSHYGSASAFQLYGNRYNLPAAISAVNTYWLRGYGDPPDAALTIGFKKDALDDLFENCRLAGKVEQRYRNYEIYLCKGAIGGWEKVWQRLQQFE